MSDTVHLLNDEVHPPPYVINELNPILPLSQSTDWGLNKLGIPNLHEIGLTGKGIKVAVLDTRVNINHPDLIGAVVKYINVTNEPDSVAENGHGTGCSGVIGARNNATGVLGIAPECQIVAIKVMKENGGGSVTDIVKGIDEAIKEKCHIINMSLGTSSDVPQMKAAVTRAANAGIHVVCAAGNDGQANSVNFPAAYENSLAIAATNASGNVSAFSSQGEAVDLAAPGERILTCWKNNSYATVSGTCIRGDQLVHTDRGYKEISQIKIGDRVQTLNEDTQELEFREVTNKISNGVKTVYAVQTNNGEIVCTENHPFLQGFVEDVGQRNVSGQRVYKRDLRWTQLKDLKEGDIITMSQVRKDTQVSFDILKEVKVELPFFNLDTAYMLGYWLGDGWFIVNGLSIYAKGDFWEELLSRTLKAFPDNKVTNRYREDRNEYSIHVYGEKLKQSLKFLGVKGGAKNKEIPAFVFGLPLEYRTAVLAGLFDSDGTIHEHVSGRNAALKVSSKEFARGFKRLLESMDIRCSNIYEQTRQGGQIRGRQLPIATSFSSTTYQFYKLQPLKEYLLDERYVDVLEDNQSDYLSQNTVGRVKINGRKVRPPQLNNEDLYYGKIVEIRELGEDEVWDITVDGNHNFLCENFIVHNSFSSPAVAGILALFLQAKLAVTHQNLYDTAIDIGIFGRDTSSGYGLINPNGYVARFTVPEPSESPSESASLSPSESASISPSASESTSGSPSSSESPSESPSESLSVSASPSAPIPEPTEKLEEARVKAGEIASKAAEVVRLLGEFLGL